MIETFEGTLRPNLFVTLIFALGYKSSEFEIRTSCTPMQDQEILDSNEISSKVKAVTFSPNQFADDF